MLWGRVWSVPVPSAGLVLTPQQNGREIHTSRSLTKLPHTHTANPACRGNTKKHIELTQITTYATLRSFTLCMHFCFSKLTLLKYFTTYVAVVVCVCVMLYVKSQNKLLVHVHPLTVRFQAGLEIKFKANKLPSGYFDWKKTSYKYTLLITCTLIIFKLLNGNPDKNITTTLYRVLTERSYKDFPM